MTGKRPSDQDDAALIEALRPRVSTVLAMVRDQMGALARSVAKECAASSERKAVPIYRADDPSLRLLSPLAEGADRVVAEAACNLGYMLEVALPFERAEYELDFPTSVTEFETLLARADGRVLELDGARGADEARSYQAVGRLVAQNSDLLIAVWDGDDASGLGGTGDIVPYAVRAGVPVWWISTDREAPPRLVTKLTQLRQPALAPSGVDADAALAQYLRNIVTLPPHPPPHRHGLLGRALHLGCRLFRHDPAPLQVYLREGTRKPRWVWRHYKWLLRLAGGPEADEVTQVPAAGEVEVYWDELYSRADRVSRQFGDRYRSSYVLIFVLAAAALSCSAVGLGLAGLAASYERLSAAFDIVEVITGMAELTALLGILLLVVFNHLHRWHERWISYRLLAELCRKQRVLAILARALPGTEIADLAADAGHGEGMAPREAWVAWYFAAWQRASPLPHASLRGEVLDRAAAVGRGMLKEQIAYHRDREQRCRGASEHLSLLGGALFMVTAVIIVAHLWVIGRSAWSEVLGVTAALLPIVSAGLVGIRAYAEFDLLAEESDRMVRVMTPALANIASVAFRHSLASSDLGAELSSVTAAMLVDVRGWAQLFRVKAVEAS